MNMRIGNNLEQRTIFGRTLVELGSRYQNLIVFDSDVGPSTRTHLFQDAYPERFMQIGIAEQNMVGIAAGMSTVGYIPLISAFAAFLTTRAGDQIRNSIAYPGANVKINGAYGGLPTGRGGATHSAIEDISIMRAMPNMMVLEPADGREVELCMQLALEVEGPVYIRTVRCSTPTIFSDEHKVLPGKAVKIRDGNDLTIISSGMMTYKAILAATKLEGYGLSASLLHIPCIKPIDKGAIIEAASATKVIITVENHSVIGGLGSTVCEIVAKDAPCRVYRLGFQDIFLESGDDEELFTDYGMNTENIVQKVLDVVKKAIVL